MVTSGLTSDPPLSGCRPLQEIIGRVMHIRDRAAVHCLMMIGLMHPGQCALALLPSK